MAGYSAEEVDGAVDALEKKTERQIGTRTSAVKGVAAERDLLSAAEVCRDLLLKAAKGQKDVLNEVFGGTCERIGRCRLCLDRVQFSDMHAKDQRWQHLRSAVDTVEAILKDLGTYKPWVPQNCKAPSKLVYRGMRRRVSPGRRVNFRPEIEGDEAEFSVEPTLPSGLELNATTGLITGMVARGAVAPEEVVYVVTAKNAAGEAKCECVFAVAEVPPTSLRYPQVKSELFTGEVVRWQPEVDGGGPTEWSAEPALPAALQLDNATGVISGCCSEAVDEAEYVVSAANEGGKVTTALRLSARVKPPSALVYKGFTEDLVLLVGADVEFLPEENVPGVSFSISPSLPDGLAIDEVTGAIRGAPKVPIVNQKPFEVKAQNKGGEVTTSISFEVRLMPPRSVSYPSASERLLTGVEIELLPQVVGVVSKWSVAPSLPTGITLGANGIISGTPTEVVKLRSWKVTASNDAGECACELIFAVEMSPPSELSYPKLKLEVEYAQWLPMNIEPEFVGMVDEFEISPDLPAGLRLDSKTGVISGTATVAAEGFSYEVTARNSTGATSVVVSFSVVLKAPTGLRYPSLREKFQAFQTLEDTKPEIIGGGISFAIEPPLPSGLQFCATSGAITGAAQTMATMNTYTVTASNEAGSTSTQFSFAVVAPPPSELTYPEASPSYSVGECVTIEPNLEGLTQGCSYSVKPRLPEAFLLDARTGIISGASEAACDESTYVITVKNESGSSKVEMTFEIVEAVNEDDVAKTIDSKFAELMEAVTDVAELLPEPSKAKQYGDWMIWMVHRAFLNDPELVDFDFSNMHMPPPHVEARIAPKLMKALVDNTHIESLTLPNANLMRVQGNELADALATNTTLRSINVESNNLDSTAVQKIGEAIAANKGSQFETLRMANQKQVGRFFGRPVEEAVGQMMEKNETIIRLGFECNDAHWRNIIDRALLRNNDFHRRRKKKTTASEEDVVAEEKPLSRLALKGRPQKNASEVFAEAVPESQVFVKFLIKNKKLPVGSQLQNFAKSEGTPLKYSQVAPLMKDCRKRTVDSAVNTQVAVTDTFEVDSDGDMRAWSENNGNWSLDFWTPDGKRYNYKASNPDLPISLSDDFVDWLQSTM